MLAPLSDKTRADLGWDLLLEHLVRRCHTDRGMDLARRVAPLQGLDDAHAMQEEVAEALAGAVAGIGAEWLPRLESACLALPRDGSVALAAGSALAERGLWGKARTLLEQAGGDDALAAASRRKAWIALAELATREGDATHAARCYEAAARLV